MSSSGSSSITVVGYQLHQVKAEQSIQYKMASYSAAIYIHQLFDMYYVSINPDVRIYICCLSIKLLVIISIG
jgi:RsiW-degrading membrane proteinase PrsW (M82 family)